MHGFRKVLTQKESFEVNLLHRLYRIRNYCDIPPMSSLIGELQNSGVNPNSVILKPNDREDTIDPLNPIFYNHDVGSTRKHWRITSIKIFHVTSELRFYWIKTRLPPQ